MTKHYLAHSSTDSHPEGQPLREHLNEVASMASQFAEKFGAGEEGFFAGMLHDIGKYTKEFQRRLAGSTERVDHATAGAYEAAKQKANAAAFAIAGHHGGLPDRGSKFDERSLSGRMSREYRETLPDYSVFQEEITLPPAPAVLPPDLDFFFHTKMLFSCLVDADWSDTSRYYGEAPEEEHTYATLGELNARLDAHLAGFAEDGKAIHILRNRIRHGVLDHSDDPPGLFSLTVPTGGGKTLASMAFALKHALRHGLERIVYVIPYCSILEQTADVFRKCFGAENLCLHYSTAEMKALEAEEKADPNAPVSERWDAPIVLTTSVQFFESLYANKPARCRKLHHLAKSVLIFDEAQMLPLPYLSPCVFAICQLVKNFGSTALLCTATQPSLGRLIEKYLPGQRVTELCPDREEMAERFRRVTYRMEEGVFSDEALLGQLSEEARVLAVVNNRRQAQTLYEGLEKEGRFCLTTYLTPHDRKAALAEIKRRLNAKEVCRVVSTSLIEAGVDLDFPTVWRALAGLDSIVQTGGRCNREGKEAAEKSIVHIFKSKAKAPRSLGQNISAAERTMRNHPEDPAGFSAMSAYFDFLFEVLKGEEGKDRKAIMDEVPKFAYETIAREFRIIEEEGSGLLYIREKGGDAVIDELEKGPPYTRSLLREAALFAVSLPKETIDSLIGRGKAKPLFENGALLLDSACYSETLGFLATEEDKAIFV